MTYRSLFFLILVLLLFTDVSHVNGQCSTAITTYPYAEDFESSDGGWISGGTGNDWVWGSPSKPVITGAGSGQKCWITGGLTASVYASGARSFVQSPCFDFTNVAQPYFSARIFWETEKQFDGATFQYSLDAGLTWTNVGSKQDGVDCRNKNWFNYTPITNLGNLASIKDGWSGNVQPTSGSCLGGFGSGLWIDVEHSMPYLAGKPQVIFRFAFGSGTACNSYDGFAFDKIIIDNTPLPPTLTEQHTASGCTLNNGTASIILNGGTPPFTFNWNPNVSITSQANNLPPGTYTVAVTDTFGCSVTIQFDVPKSPDITLNLFTNPDTCGLGKGRASAIAGSGSPPFTFVWSTGNTTDKLFFLKSNTYTVTVTDLAGCTINQELFILDTGYYSINLGQDFIICGKANRTITPGIFSGYFWQDGSNNSQYQINEAGIYNVEVTDSHGCKATDTIVVIENCLDDIILPNSFTPNGDGFNDIFFASGQGITSFNLKIFNRWGQIVFEGTRPESGWDGNFRGLPGPSGSYIFKAVYSISGGKDKEKTGTIFLIR